MAQPIVKKENKKEINEKLEAMGRSALIAVVKGCNKKEQEIINKEREFERDNARLRKITEEANKTARYATDKLANEESAKKNAHERLGKYKTAIEAIMATKYPGKLRYVIGRQFRDPSIAITLETEMEITNKEWEEINLLNYLHELASI